MLAKASLSRAEVSMVAIHDPPAKTRSTVCRFPGRCRIGLGSGTLPLVKQMRSIALACQEPIFLPIGGAGENRWRIEASEDKGLSRPFRFWRRGSRQMAAHQTTTPNPSIEGKSKMLRILYSPHVKR